MIAGELCDGAGAATGTDGVEAGEATGRAAGDRHGVAVSAGADQKGAGNGRGGAAGRGAVGRAGARGVGKQCAGGAYAGELRDIHDGVCAAVEDDADACAGAGADDAVPDLKIGVEAIGAPVAGAPADVTLRNGRYVYRRKGRVGGVGGNDGDEHVALGGSAA